MRTSDLSRIRHHILTDARHAEQDAAFAAGVDRALAAVRRFMLEERRATEQDLARGAAGASPPREPSRTARMI